MELESGHGYTILWIYPNHWFVHFKRMDFTYVNYINIKRDYRTRNTWPPKKSFSVNLCILAYSSSTLPHISNHPLSDTWHQSFSTFLDIRKRCALVSFLPKIKQTKYLSLRSYETLIYHRLLASLQMSHWVNRRAIKLQTTKNSLYFQYIRERAPVNTSLHSMKKTDWLILKFWFFVRRTLAIEEKILLST